MIPNVSQAVLGGLEKLNGSDDELVRQAGLARDRIAAVRNGTSEFDDDEVARIEDAADMTVGQLACLITEPDGGPLTDLSDGWAEFRRSLNTTRPATARPAGAGSAT